MEEDDSIDYYVENRKRMLNELNDQDKEQMMKDFEMPSIDEIMKLIDSFHGVSEEDKEKLRQNMLKRIAEGDLSPGNPDVNKFPPLKHRNHYEPTYHEVIIFFIMVAIILFVIVFIGYKLYKSLMEKDRKREEKQKAKQSKKKK